MYQKSCLVYATPDLESKISCRLYSHISQCSGYTVFIDQQCISHDGILGISNWWACLSDAGLQAGSIDSWSSKLKGHSCLHILGKTMQDIHCVHISIIRHSSYRSQPHCRFISSCLAGCVALEHRCSYKPRNKLRTMQGQYWPTCHVACHLLCSKRFELACLLFTNNMQWSEVTGALGCALTLYPSRVRQKLQPPPPKPPQFTATAISKVAAKLPAVQILLFLFTVLARLNKESSPPLSVLIPPLPRGISRTHISAAIHSPMCSLQCRDLRGSETARTGHSSTIIQQNWASKHWSSKHC